MATKGLCLNKRYDIKIQPFILLMTIIMSLIHAMLVRKFCRNYTQKIIGSELTPQLLQLFPSWFYRTNISV
jgi:hypothetical protein